MASAAAPISDPARGHGGPGRYLPLGAVALGVVAAAGLKRIVGPLDQWAVVHMPPLCPIRALTGIPCPTCGLGRGLLAAVGGDVATAFNHHPLAAPLLIFVTAIAALYAGNPEWTRAFLRRLATAPRCHPRTIWSLLALYIGWGVGRLL